MLQCISETTKYFSENRVCSHPLEFSTDCVYCQANIGDLFESNLQVKKCKNYFLDWLKEYFAFNGVDGYMVLRFERIMNICASYPSCFKSPINPLINEFLKSIESLGIITEDEDEMNMREILV